MHSKLACLVLVLAMVACGESRNRVGSNHPDGAPGSGGAQGSSAGGGSIAASGAGAGGGSDTAGGTGAGGLSNASGGTGSGGQGGLSASAIGGRGGSSTGTPASGGNTRSPDAGASTGGKLLLDGGSPNLDGPAPSDARLANDPDGAGFNPDTRRADTFADSPNTFCHTTSTGCQCTAIPTTEPSVTVCNNESQDETHLGRCCAASDYCVCDVLACVTDTPTGRCWCDFAALLATLPSTWNVVGQCPAPATGFKCCLFGDASYCQCKQQECTDGSTEVANCALSQLNTCASGAALVDSCK